MLLISGLSSRCRCGRPGRGGLVRACRLGSLGGPAVDRLPGAARLLALLIRGKARSPILAIGPGMAGRCPLPLPLLLENGVWHEFLKSVSILSGTGRSIAKPCLGARGSVHRAQQHRFAGGAGAAPVSGCRRGEFGFARRWASVCWRGCLFLACWPWPASMPDTMLDGVHSDGRLCCGRASERPVEPVACASCRYCCCVAAGLPARLAVTLREWKLRDPDPVNRLVAEQVRPTDWVYSEYEAYYPAKKAAAVLFLPPMPAWPRRWMGSSRPLGRRPGRGGHPDPETADPRTLRFFGGRWSLVGH